MTPPSRLLDFFVLEATEYLSRIEAATARSGAFDPGALKAGARGLRGSATMARAGGIASLAARLEAVATRLAAGEIALSPAIERLLKSTAETLDTLVRSVRLWNPERDERVRAALAELEPYAPADSSRPEDAIVPISELFFSDAGPHVVEVAASARTTFEQRLREKQTKPAAAPALSPAFPSPAPARAPQKSGLRGAALRDALGSSLAAMSSLEHPGASTAAQAIVPIRSLLYRGSRAVLRAKELRAQIQNAPGAAAGELIAELCDLVELASAE